MAGDTRYPTCAYGEKSSRKISDREFARVVTGYHLTPAKISRVHDSLKS